jgi:hypothetical protein
MAGTGDARAEEFRSSTWLSRNAGSSGGLKTMG